ncbi:uncharacterized protein TNCV_685491 [Trichonephila clavipes]|nr:uncharacterized protein TNCV_685491 [Trichonephila clavipes]
MKNTIAFKNNKTKQNVDISQIRRWVLKCVSKTTPATAVTMHCIKKFLDSKHNGISRLPETKLVIKNLINSGRLVKIDGRIATGKTNQKHENVQKNVSKSTQNREMEGTNGKEAESDARKVISVAKVTESTGNESEMMANQQDTAERETETAAKKMENAGKGNEDVEMKSMLERYTDKGSVHKSNISSAKANKKERRPSNPKRKNSKLRSLSKITGKKNSQKDCYPGKTGSFGGRPPHMSTMKETVRVGTSSRRDETFLVRLRSGHTGAQRHLTGLPSVSELQCESSRSFPHLGLYWLP